MKTFAALLVAMFVLVCAACGAAGADNVDSSPVAGVQGEIIVFAASSLTDAFTEAAAAFEQGHPGADVVLNFASSSSLATQINERAPADVFASANQAQLDAVRDSGYASDERVFATNDLVVAVPRESDTVGEFSDLADPGVRLVLAAPEVPVGTYARQAIQKAGNSGAYGADFADRVLANVRSAEPNVRAVLTKAQLGEADAVIVYSTDAAVAADDVDTLPIPDEFNVVAEYPIAPLAGGGNPAGGRAFVEFILSEEGQSILAGHGFGKAG